MLIQIAILIIVVVGCVHVVHKHAHKEGVEVGISKGRLQILEENLIRQDCKKNELSDGVDSFVNSQSVNQHSRQACKYIEN